jgi:hypothetical protein
VYKENIMADNKPGLLGTIGDATMSVGRGIADQSGLTRLISTGLSLRERRLGRRPGAVVAPPNFDVKFIGDKDFRVKIKVPVEYLYTTGVAYTGQLFDIGGIIFPFTPTISQDYTASYATVNPTHSNYALHFYKSSQPGPISVTGKFTVQNNEEAYLWLRTTHMLRAVTKMKFGKDANAGSPPPVCRFDAYGEQQYKNVPVVVSSFKVDLPDNVDYYATKIDDRLGGGDKPTGTMVPTISQITVTLLPMYSRQELLGQAQVDDYISGSPNLRRKGFL